MSLSKVKKSLGISKKCPECKEKLSDSARACPECGYSFSNPTQIQPGFQIRQIKVGNNECCATSFLVLLATILLAYKFLSLQYLFLAVLLGLIVLGILSFALIGGRWMRLRQLFRN